MRNNVENFKKFKADLDKFRKTIDVSLSVLVTTLATKIFTGIVEKTPVDKGTAVANWQVAVDQAATETFSEYEGAANQAISQTLGKLKSALPRIRKNSVIVIYNNVPYIKKLEYGGYKPGPLVEGGYSKKAPRGFVRLTLLEIEQEINNIIKGL